MKGWGEMKEIYQNYKCILMWFGVEFSVVYSWRKSVEKYGKKTETIATATTIYISHIKLIHQQWIQWMLCNEVLNVKGALNELIEKRQNSTIWYILSLPPPFYVSGIVLC